MNENAFVVGVFDSEALDRDAAGLNQNAISQPGRVNRGSIAFPRDADERQSGERWGNRQVLRIGAIEDVDGVAGSGGGDGATDRAVKRGFAAVLFRLRIGNWVWADAANRGASGCAKGDRN